MRLTYQIEIGARQVKHALINKQLRLAVARIVDDMVNRGAVAAEADYRVDKRINIDLGAVVRIGDAQHMQQLVKKNQ